MGALDGQHALVTGAGSGIGAAIARSLAADGASVTLAGRRRTPLEAVAKSLQRAHVAIADVTQQDDCAAMAASARAALGPIDIVVANAGAAMSAPLARVDADHWQRMLNVNLTGAFFTAQVGLGDLTRRDIARKAHGRIVFVASTAGLKGYPYVAAYCAAKHGVIGLMRAMAAELATRGVTVNAVCPGFTETDILTRSVAGIVAATGRTEAEARADLARSNPQGRFVTADEVAATVAWLCSPAAQSITGQAISISGGEV